MKRLIATVVLLLWAAPVLLAEDIKPAIFIPPTGDGMEVLIAAAMTKKNVPVTVATSADGAQLTLKATPIQVRKVRVKFSACVLQACGSSNDKSGPGAQLLDRDGAVVWTCAVETDDESTKKEVAEEIASRLKKDYFRQ